MYSLRQHPFFELGDSNPDLLNLYIAVMETISWLGDSTANLNQFKKWVDNSHDFFIERNARVLQSSGKKHYFRFWDSDARGWFLMLILYGVPIFIISLVLVELWTGFLCIASNVFQVRKGDSKKLSEISISTVCTQMETEPRDIRIRFFNSTGILS